MNTKNFREVELKFTTEVPYSEAAMTLRKLYKRLTPLICSTTDHYWPGLKTGQFLRLRSSSGNIGKIRKSLTELTVKNKDKKTNSDRLEVNLDVDWQTAYVMVKAIFGSTLERIDKDEVVYFLPGSIVVSLANVNQGDVYLEVEGPSLGVIKRELARIKKHVKLKREYKSLFEIYAAPLLKVA